MSNHNNSQRPQPLSIGLARKLKDLSVVPNEGLLSGLPLSQVSKKISPEARVRCSQCRGTTSAGKCPMCHGGGLVCPKCRGMRFLRTGMENWVTQIERCPSCLHPDDETAAIAAYLQNWVRHHPFDESDEAQS